MNTAQTSLTAPAANHDDDTLENAGRYAVLHGHAESMDWNFRDDVVTAFREVALCRYIADTGTQLQKRLRSPWTLSTRPTGGQYLRRSIPATGNAASSRV